MTLVIDASVAIKWVLDEPGSDEAEGLLSQPLLAPSLFRAECANVLWKAWRRGELREDEARVKLAQVLDEAGVELREPPAGDALRLAIALRHGAYDCFYLALAMSTSATLVTADHKFADKIAAAGLATTVRRIGAAHP